jgi:hypothetical protein
MCFFWVVLLVWICFFFTTVLAHFTHDPTNMSPPSLFLFFVSCLLSSFSFPPYPTHVERSFVSREQKFERCCGWRGRSLFPFVLPGGDVWIALWRRAVLRDAHVYNIGHGMLNAYTRIIYSALLPACDVHCRAAQPYSTLASTTVRSLDPPSSIAARKPSSLHCASTQVQCGWVVQRYLGTP